MNKHRLLATAAALAAPLALAAPDPWEAPFTIQVGAFSAEAETMLRLDRNNGRFGTQVSFEGDLGGEDRKTLPTLELLWRFSPANAIEASVVSLRREGAPVEPFVEQAGTRTTARRRAILRRVDMATELGR